MQDFEEVLLSEQKNPNALVLEFITSDYDETDVVAFVEGVNDPQFYYDLIVDIIPNRQIRFFDCGGKKAVLSVKSFIDTYNLTRKPFKLLYLCDSDFDIITGERYEGVFTTKFYSIESYFADSSYINYLIEKYCSKAISKSVKAKIVSQISSEMNYLSSYLRVPMAYMCCVRQNNNDADFDKLSIVSFLSFQDHKTAVKKCRNRVSEIISKSGATDLNIPIKKVLCYARMIRKLNYKHWLRGKMSLQLLKICLSRSINQFSPSIREAANNLRHHIGATSLAQSRTFLRVVPDLTAYVQSA